MSSSANYNRTEILIGIIVLIGVLYVIYVAIGLAGWAFLGKHGYILYADFFSASGLHVGDPVEIAGVNVGKVESISLDDYQARVGLRIKDGITIQQDANAAIESKGLVGDRSVSIEPGNSAKPLGPVDEIKETESPTSFQDLVAKLVTGDLLSGE
jgi:phospholipid/cholesterol/gamma-HCH transport system substrate-binding protein